MQTTLMTGVVLCNIRLQLLIALSGFITEPESITVPEGQSAAFSCAGQALSLFWIVNDAVHNDGSTEEGITVILLPPLME